ncbi:MAG: hypothetical protein K8S21_13545 [Gemmatimonadetes bacterium]|nr:hypothetical protein [Gemmatimonadota bacterium]
MPFERRSRRTLLAAVHRASALGLFLCAAASSAGAQGQSRLWYELTVGGSGARLTCDYCAPARDVGAAAALAVGAYAGDRVRVGVELSRWTYRDQDVRERIKGVGVVAHLVPDPKRGLYLLGGAGWTAYRAGEFAYDAPRITVGLGWDIPAFGNWVVGNVVALDAASFGSLRNGGTTVVRDVGLSAVRASVQLRRR